eukprot:5181082-Pleurochrysis_carterae.AAC.1
MQPRARPRPRRRLACARWPPLLRATARDAARETIVPKLPYSFCALINFSVEPALRALVGDAWGAVDVIVVFARASQSASEHNSAP